MPFRVATSPMSRRTSIMPTPSDQLQEIELFEPVSLHHLQTLFRHDRERTVFDGLLQRELPRYDLFQVTPEGVLVPFHQVHRAEDLGFALAVRTHLLEPFPVAFNPAEIFVEPDDDVAVRRAVRQALEAVQGIKKR